VDLTESPAPRSSSSELVSLVSQVRDRVIAIRRDIRAHPELAYQETRTGSLVAEVLRELGVEVRAGVARTGVVGLLRGDSPGRTIALRADMDALAMDDGLKAPYASTIPGVAHTCGHDAHVAMLLGTAMVLSRLRHRLAGNVKLIFEPAEEIINNESKPGAQVVIEEGVLDDPEVDAVLGCHVFPEYPTGHVALRGGVQMTGLDTFDLTILGQQAHTATMEKGVDAIVAAAHVLTALQTLPSREVNPNESLVVHIGTIHGGTARQMLADRVAMAGSVRVGDQSLRKTLRQRVERVVRGVTESLRAGYELSWQENYLGPVVNDDGLAEAVANAARRALGKDKVIWMPQPRLAAESFHHYSDHVPSVFWFLGTGNPAKGTDLSSHHQCFDVDEDALPAGVATFCQSCLDLLSLGKA
jgi:amidohydrolase